MMRLRTQELGDEMGCDGCENSDMRVPCWLEDRVSGRGWVLGVERYFYSAIYGGGRGRKRGEEG